MTSARWLPGSSALLLLCLSSPPAFALAISATINGTTVSCTADPCPIANTYGSLTVSNDGGTAQVRTQDGNADFIILENAKFATSSNAMNGSVVFSATFASPPDAPPATYVEGKRVAAGSLVRPPTSAPYAVGNVGWFTVDGLINNTSIVGPQTKTVTCLLAACGVISQSTFTKTYNFYPTFNGSREMKGTFQFYLPLANDYLKITQVKIETNAKAGDIDQATLEQNMADQGVYEGPHKETSQPCDKKESDLKTGLGHVKDKPCKKGEPCN